MLQEQAVSPYLLISLKRLMSVAELNDFRLVGGTALALYLGHRISADIGLFTDNREAPMFAIKSLLTTRFDYKIKEEYFDFRQEKFIGFSFENKTVLHDILIKDRRFLDAPNIIDGIRLASLKDIAISKLNAITERLAKKDFIDLYFLHEQVDLVKVFNEDFFKVFPLEKTKSVLKLLSSVADVMSNKSEMPKILDSKSFDVEKMNDVIHLVVSKCCESRGLIPLKKTT